MDNVPRPRYSIRDHVVQHQGLVPVLINAFAVQMMGINLTATAQQAHDAGMKVGARAAVCRAYDYLQTALNIVSNSPGRKNDSMKNEFRNDIGSSLKRLEQIADATELHDILAVRRDTGPYAPDQSEYAPFHHWFQAHIAAQVLQTVNRRILHPPGEPFQTLDWETRDGALAAMHRIHREMVQQVNDHDPQPPAPPGTYLTSRVKDMHHNCVHQLDLADADIQHEAHLHHQALRQYPGPDLLPQRLIDAINQEPLIPGTTRTMIDHEPEPQDPVALYMMRIHSAILVVPDGPVEMTQTPSGEPPKRFRHMLVHAALDFRQYGVRPPAQLIRSLSAAAGIDQRKRSKQRDRDIEQLLQAAFRALTNPESLPDDVPPEVETALQPEHHLTPIAG